MARHNSNPPQRRRSFRDGASAPIFLSFFAVKMPDPTAGCAEPVFPQHPGYRRARRWEGRGLARWRRLPRFQPPPVNPCMRFSRTRLTDIVHRQACVLCQVIVPESRWTPKRRYQA